MRNFALRARGFRAISSSEGTITLLFTSSNGTCALPKSQFPLSRPNGRYACSSSPCGLRRCGMKSPPTGRLPARAASFAPKIPTRRRFRGSPPSARLETLAPTPFLLPRIDKRPRHCCQIGCRLYLCRRASFHDGRSQPTGIFQIAIQAKQRSKLLFVVFGNHFMRRNAAVAIHPHVEHPFPVTKGKPRAASSKW